MVAHRIEATGGQEEVHRRLVHELLERNYRLVLVTGRCDLDTSPELQIVHVEGPTRPASLRFPTFYYGSARAVGRYGRGLIHTSGAVAPIFMDVATMHFCHAYYQSEIALARSSRATLAHRMNELAFSAMALAAERRTLRPGRVCQLVAVSEGLAREARRCYPQIAPSVRVIPNGVDTDRSAAGVKGRTASRAELGMSDHTLVALFVGGDWERKGLQVAIEALTHAPDWTLLIAGRGDTRRLLMRSSELGVRERVIYLGFRSDIERWYAASDVFVLPTAYETWSLAAYEAAATGLPIVAPPVHGIDHLLHSGGGITVERSPAAVASALTRLVSRDLRQTKGRRARALASEFTWSNVAAQYARLYDEIAHDPHPEDMPAHASPA
jgi:glycosyltransferase involved in cell wall biosynthesis